MSEEPAKQGQPKPDDLPALPPGKGSAESNAALTPEEQMALYEQDLKENDWGHQPC